MKHLIIIALAITISGFNNEASFCECWEEGYVEGYCLEQVPGACVTPAVPPCLVSPAGRNTCKDGYKIGIKDGVKDYQENL